MNTQNRAVEAFDRGAVRSIEGLDREIVSLSRRMATTEYELLVLIREFDERGGWLQWGSASCADWLHWRCDLSLSAAREKVRVAHALKALPEISRSFQSGSLTYSKVRALTRVANRDNEADLLRFALEVSAALVEQHCQQLRNVRSESTATAQRSYDQRLLSASRDRARNTLTLTVVLPIEEGEVVLNALDRVLAEDEQSADASPSYRARQADALLELCRRAGVCQRVERATPEVDAADSESLRGGLLSDNPDSRPRTLSSADQYQVVIHVDESALMDTPKAAARSDLPAETVRRLSCDGTLVPIRSAANGTPLDIGRKRRTVSTALKRALLARDRQCRFPGCSHSRFVDAHHVQHWAQGGDTRLDNLMLLCSHHHRLVHEGGFSIFVENDGQQSFRRPDGRAVPACGYRPEDQADED
jgi:hypothetical protein